ncbi:MULTISPECIES: DUF423 domain-containing protein [unclassified Sphingobium]|uniref:DUF423 domain-containing protein n=1 Tax=unclassified Sphingobium TaxID=2611147 RepID=UPI0022245696|nr:MULTISPECIES: DUF423 domain-containing protein [unclassified Sphingobium]MCW2412127.1 uncharacterized membrane protein YgdD (TMEM256/DUF423 family) [Sphingobium sp. B8D3D]MCW2415576.1 uncharacterized membrane protein YgdD (TMEM256/DUF423 family) [Sphingobium sp. B8D3A]
MIGMLAALSAALSIGASAFGAHAASSPQAAEWLRTGGVYQLVHAVAVLAILRLPVSSGPSWALLGGSALFAATLYAMALGAPRWLGAITPIGGVVMILGWLWLAWQLTRAD